MGRAPRGLDVRRGATAILLVTSAATLMSCGGGSALRPFPDPTGFEPSCTGAYRIDSALDLPLRIEVWNGTDTEVRLALDGCELQQHLGWVRPETWTFFAVPGSLVLFPEGLRFHVYALETEASIRTFHVEPRGTVARLVIPRSGGSGAGSG